MNHRNHMYCHSHKDGNPAFHMIILKKILDSNLCENDGLEANVQPLFRMDQ